MDGVFVTFSHRKQTHLLSQIPYEEIPREAVKLGKRKSKGEYDDQATLRGRTFVPERY